MICYHGTPLSGGNKIIAECFNYRDAMVSFFAPDAIETCAEICRSVVLDNGAFSAWRAGRPVENWSAYYSWVDKWHRHPSVLWACIPDVIDGDEDANDELIERWPHGSFGVPVWHLHESMERLHRLAICFGTVALGSSGQYAEVGTTSWWHRMSEAMSEVCDEEGRPKVKLHGLRMLDPTVLAHLPLASGDSTNCGRNIGIDNAWKGTYAPTSRSVRAIVIMDRIENHAKASRWCGTSGRQMNFELLDYG